MSAPVPGAHVTMMDRNPSYSNSVHREYLWSHVLSGGGTSGTRSLLGVGMPGLRSLPQMVGGYVG